MKKIIKEQKIAKSISIIRAFFCTSLFASTLLYAQDATQEVEQIINQEDKKEEQKAQDKQYNTLQEALKNGGVTGDVGVLGVYQKEQGGEDLGYVGGTVGLTYQSGFYKNFRLSLGFRSALPFWQLHKSYSADSLYPIGDMKEDFDPRYPTILSDSYLQYLYNGHNLRAGRVYVENEWVDNQVDGISYTNTSIDGLTFDLAWFYSFGEVASDAITAFKRANPNHWSGFYYTSLSYLFLDEILNAKLYTFGSYEIAYAIGGNLSAEYELENNLKLGAYLNSAISLEQKKSEFSENGFDLDTKISIGYEKEDYNLGWSLGYIKSGKNVGWGSLSQISDTINPFEIGSGFEGVDLNTFYTSISVGFERYTLNLLYGISSFKDATNAKGKQNEFDLTLEIQATDELLVYGGIYNTHSSELAPNTTKGQIGISYSF